jgi:1-acyl-sn-glycerol-3-phosphate acyltransferase
MPPAVAIALSQSDWPSRYTHSCPVVWRLHADPDTDQGWLLLNPSRPVQWSEDGDRSISSLGSRPMPILIENVGDRRMPAFARVVWEHVVFWVGLAALALSGIIVTLLAIVVAPFLPKVQRVRMGQGILHYFFRHYFGVLAFTGLFRFEIDELTSLIHERPMVLVANHPALLDAMLVAARVPNVVGIMKADVRHSPVYAGAAMLAGYACADRPIEMIHSMVNALHAGHHVLVFPESTRTVRRPVNPFKGNFGLIAKQAGVPVQALIIETDSPYLGKGWSMLRKPRMPVCFKVRLGRRFDGCADVKPFTREVEAYFASELVSGTFDRPVA